MNDLEGIDIDKAIAVRERADANGQTNRRMVAPDPEYPLRQFRYLDADDIEYRLIDGELRRVPLKKKGQESA